jgi:hypothetical protein
MLEKMSQKMISPQVRWYSVKEEVSMQGCQEVQLRWVVSVQWIQKDKNHYIQLLMECSVNIMNNQISILVAT